MERDCCTTFRDLVIRMSWRRLVVGDRPAERQARFSLSAPPSA
jgi:hypothetical protein